MHFEPTPGPHGLLIVSNALNLRDTEATIRLFDRLADTYGPIFQLTVNGQSLVVIASAEMIRKLWTRKGPSKPLYQCYLGRAHQMD